MFIAGRRYNLSAHRVVADAIVHVHALIVTITTHRDLLQLMLRVQHNCVFILIQFRNLYYEAKRNSALPARFR